MDLTNFEEMLCYVYVSFQLTQNAYDWPCVCVIMPALLSENKALKINKINVLSLTWEMFSYSWIAGLLALLDENEQDLKVCFVFTKSLKIIELWLSLTTVN